MRKRPKQSEETGCRANRLFALCNWLTMILIIGTVMANGVQAAVNPAAFVNRIDNPYYPLIPGSTYHYEGTLDRLDVIAITHETKLVEGVACTVVHNRAMVNGVLSEESFDWFAISF